MANTSATGGYLAPAVESPPLTDDALDALFQGAISAITGLAGQYVRPRWQAVPPKQPEPAVDWCAIGVMAVDSDAGPSITHAGTGDGQDDYARHEDISVLCSFYGPLALRYALKARDGLCILQNSESTGGVRFISSDPIRPAPEFINQQWVRRYDLALTFRRKVSRTYPILNILSADPALTADNHGD